MNKFSIFAKDPEKGDALKKEMQGLGFQYSDDPDFIVTMGGDGTFLNSERKFPGVPKLLVRDSLICFKCHDEPIEDMLKNIKEGKGRVHEMIKLEAKHGDKILVATNDITIRNKDPGRAIRFAVKIDGKETDLLVGDGVVISTVFGSTGYYHAITRKSFDSGIGLCYNNTTRKMEPLHLDDDSEIIVNVVRGEADVVADNNNDIWVLGDNEKITIKKSSEVARILGHNGD